MNLLLAALLLPQDKIAEDTFRKMEQTIEKASSVTLTFTAEGKSVREGVPKAGRPGSVALLLGLILLVTAAGLGSIPLPMNTCSCSEGGSSVPKTDFGFRV